MSPRFQEDSSIDISFSQTEQRTAFSQQLSPTHQNIAGDRIRQSQADQPKDRRGKARHAVRSLIQFTGVAAKIINKILHAWCAVCLILGSHLHYAHAVFQHARHTDIRSDNLLQNAPPGAPALSHSKSKHNRPTYHKRSLGKAIRRAHNSASGQTEYSGSARAAQDLQCSRPHQQQLRRTTHQHRQIRSMRNNTIGVISFNTVAWNADGLEGGVWEEFMIWLSQIPAQNQPHIITIQETHWKHNAEWTSNGWYCISPGAAEKDRSAGLLTMIRIPGVQLQHIRFRRVLQGRLDHIRVELKGANLDILNVYQKAVSFSQSDDAYAKRTSLWKSIALVLSGLPSRNLLSIQGDFNTQLASSRPWMGPCTCHKEGDEQISRDHRDMLDILMRFDLTVLNSWACRRPHTYVHSSHYTMIDYIITRRSQATGRAKQSKPVQDDALTGWRDSKHFPVFAQVSYNCRSRQQAPSQRHHKYDIQKILLQNTNHATFEQQQSMIKAVSDSLSRITYCQLPSTLRHLCDTYFQQERAPKLV